jgi:hypothetical protein
MPQPIKLGKINFQSVTLQENLQLSRIQDAINVLGGYSGDIQLSSHIDLQGNRIKNVGAPVEANDATPLSTTEANYSAKSLRPKLEGGGEAALRTFITGLKGDVVATGPGVAPATVKSVADFNQIGGTLAPSQLPPGGFTGTVTLAALTNTGTQGSMTFVNGQCKSVVQPT